MQHFRFTYVPLESTRRSRIGDAVGVEISSPVLKIKWYIFDHLFRWSRWRCSRNAYLDDVSSALAALCARSVPVTLGVAVGVEPPNRADRSRTYNIVRKGQSRVACSRVRLSRGERISTGSPGAHTGVRRRRMSGLLKLSASLLPRSMPGAVTLVRT